MLLSLGLESKLMAPWSKAGLGLESESRIALEEKQTTQMAALKFSLLPWTKLTLIPSHQEEVKAEFTEP